MKFILLFVFTVVLFSACTSSDIDGKLIDVDTTSAPTLYKFKATGEKVTGTVVFFEIDSVTGARYKQRLREVVNGVRINTGFEYYPDGQIESSVNYLDGVATGLAKEYYPDGTVAAISHFSDDKLNGATDCFNKDGSEYLEIIYENGEIIKKYNYDTHGNKIIPITDYLLLLELKTGYYEDVDYNSNQLLYEPMVIMKWKNTSTESLKDDIKIKCVFISNDEEWSTETNYFQGFTDVPLQPGLARQATLKSTTGFKSFLGIGSADVYCQIYVNDIAFKKVKISNNLLTTNRIQ